ncbi:MAG TPA: alpha/beta hydrolase, partial [Candidatus Hydrogenedentes bacterium]|nr:alpha/beta hydrolase [Candidatus Hydrogenedentota bacterium]
MRRHNNARGIVMNHLLGTLAAFGVTMALLVGGFLALLGTMQVEGEYLDAEGVRIHYTDEGEGEPVILIHGLGFNSYLNWYWTGVAGQLLKQHRVIAIDCRCHGHSDAPASPELYGKEMAEDVVRVMDKLGIERAHVVGYSLGGFITMKLLAEHPDRLLSAVPCAAGWARRDVDA